jgi:hypothetical protein
LPKAFKANSGGSHILTIVVMKNYIYYYYYYLIEPQMGVLPGGSGTTTIHNTEIHITQNITPRSNKTQHTKLQNNKGQKKLRTHKH